LIGVITVSLAKYIDSVHHVETTEPADKYGREDNKVKIEDQTLPGKKLYSRIKPDQPPRSQSHQEPFKLDRREDVRLSEDDASGSPPLDQQKAQSRHDGQGETQTAGQWFKKGRALDDESEDEIQCYQKAIELDPEFAPAYYCLGAIYFRQANYELAYQEFAKFLKYASEADRRAYDIYLYCSPSDVERLSEEKLSEEKVKEQTPAEEAKKEKPSEVEKEQEETTGEERGLEKSEEVEREPEEAPGEETGQETSEEVMTVVRFVSIDGHIVVPVVLNGFLEARMLVDTGAGITVLSRELAQKLQLEGQPGNSITLKTMAIDIQAQSATLDSIKVGDLIQGYLPVAITDLPIGESRRFDGILGMDFMNNYRIHIDNENSRILLSPGKKS